MSNLLKSFNTHQSDERVIDYNEVISEKIQSFKKRMQSDSMEADGFVTGINAAVVKELIGPDTEASAAADADADGDAVSRIISDVSETNDDKHEDVKNLAQDIISDADAKAAAILEEARSEAERIKNEAFNTAKTEGYKEGYDLGASKAHDEYFNLINDVQVERTKLEEEYKTKHAAMESELVDALVDVFAKVTHTVSEDNKDIVLYLINQVMSNAQASGEFLIRVSKDDYPFLIENQGKIYIASQKEINLNIVEDDELTKNQCIIETDGGVFDCSLDIQLEQLIKEIKLLSCMAN